MAPSGLIVTPDGAAATVDAIQLTPRQAELFRAYKKQVLEPLGLVEALYCSRCWEHNLSHGCEAFVNENKIGIRCRCALRVYDGPTY